MWSVNVEYVVLCGCKCGYVGGVGGVWGGMVVCMWAG